MPPGASLFLTRSALYLHSPSFAQVTVDDPFSVSVVGFSGGDGGNAEIIINEVREILA